MEERPEDRLESENDKEREYVFRFRLPKFRRLLPEETRRHIHAAQKETLLAIRSLIDVAIEKTEQETKPEEKGPTKIELE